MKKPLIILGVILIIASLILAFYLTRYERVVEFKCKYYEDKDSYNICTKRVIDFDGDISKFGDLFIYWYFIGVLGICLVCLGLIWDLKD